MSTEEKKDTEPVKDESSPVEGYDEKDVAELIASNPCEMFN